MLSSRVILSALIGVCCVVQLTGCASRNLELEKEEYPRAIAQVQSFLRKNPEIKGKFYSDYLRSLALRIEDGLKRGNRPAREFHFILARASAPMAYSPGAGMVLFSSGLVLRLQNEAELAFVLAHELGHQELGHLAILQSSSSESVKTSQMELEADRFGLALSAIAGYDLRASLGALAHLYQGMEVSPKSDDYPTFEERINSLHQAIADSGWAPPGTIDRRDFQTMKHLLLAE